jgi:hypothetical protein
MLGLFRLFSSLRAVLCKSKEEGREKRENLYSPSSSMHKERHRDGQK